MNKTAIIALLICTVAFAQQKGTFTDTRDGKKYKYTTIGKQTWMAENLNYNAKGSKCYDNKPANCDKYGRLYNWETAKMACPKGWHLPSNVEWDKLYRFADGTSGTDSPYESKTAGKFLKATSGWNKKSGNGTDAYGFSALPGGGGSFNQVGDTGYWWSSSELVIDISEYNDPASECGRAGCDDGGPYARYMGYSSYANSSYYAESSLFSVRCLQD